MGVRGHARRVRNLRMRLYRYVRCAPRARDSVAPCDSEANELDGFLRLVAEVGLVWSDFPVSDTCTERMSHAHVSAAVCVVQ